MNILYISRYFKLKNIFFYTFILYILQLSLITKATNNNYNKRIIEKEKINNALKEVSISGLKWEKINTNGINFNEQKWQKLDDREYKSLIKKSKETNIYRKINLNSLNRSIVFDNNIVGPDISWLVPPGFSWSSSHIFDFSVRGHNRRKDGDPFLGWNGGDAVSQIYLHPIHLKKSSYGINVGVRSVYQGDAPGGKSDIGEGLSMGFRYDRELSSTSGMAIGAEQLLHFDDKTDTGRDLYITFSKGWWRNKGSTYPFPLYTATAGVATGKMAEGNIKGLCSDLFGGAGIQTATQRRLCWAPVFTFSRVFNESISTFFEYNSKWFLLGTSFVPSQNIPLRGTFALQISDHIDNYQINDFESLKWVFRLSLGF